MGLHIGEYTTGQKVGSMVFWGRTQVHPGLGGEKWPGTSYEASQGARTDRGQSVHG